jgi:hypothetical protein
MREYANTVSASHLLSVDSYLPCLSLLASRKIRLRKIEPEHRGKVELAIMFGILLAMMPAHYAKARRI